MVLLVLFVAEANAEAIEAPARNLILISIDTLRADRLGLYGYERPTSPNIDAFAAQGVAFDHTTAPAPWTLPSHASLLTGLYPSHHGAASLGHSIARDVPRLATLVKGHGFQTIAIVTSNQLTKFGLEVGFQEMEYLPESASRREPFGVVDRAIHWLEKRRDVSMRFFAFLHLYDVHSDYVALPEFVDRFAEPYDGPVDGSTRQLVQQRMGKFDIDEAGARHMSNLYDASIRQVDTQVGKLIEYLKSSSLDRNTVVALTSDHGEEFLEHGGVLHGATHFEEVVHVPLIMAGRGIPTGVRIKTPVSLIDVVPTALACLGLPIPAGLDGSELRGLWKEPDRVSDRVIFMEADHSPLSARTPGSRRAARQGRFKLHYDIFRQSAQLYDVEHDPGERRDVMEQYPEVAERMLVRLRDFLEGEQAVTPGRALDLEERQLLESLGYIEEEEPARP